MFAQPPGLERRQQLQPSGWIYVQPIAADSWPKGSVAHVPPLLMTVGVRVAVFFNDDNLWYPAFVTAYEPGLATLEYDDSKWPDELITAYQSPPLLVLVPACVAPELAEANARMAPETLAFLDGKDAVRIAAVHEALADDLLLAPSVLKPRGSTRPSSTSSMHSWSGFLGVGYLGVVWASKRWARPSSSLRFRINGRGPSSGYKDFGTPEEAALALARQRAARRSH